MKLSVTTKEGERVYEVKRSESEVWKKVGQLLPEITIPNFILVRFNGEEASLTVKTRGTYIKDGVEYPSMYVTVEYNYINLPSSDYEDRYLTCIHPESNNYKFYWLRPQGNGTLQATYGRIGTERGEMFGERDLKNPYESYLYWIRYYEKISKGYVDMTDVYLSNEEDDEDEKKGEKKSKKASAVSKELFDMLRSYAKYVVEHTLVNSNVTKMQVKKTKELLAKLGEQTEVKGFNKILSEILQLSPRDMTYEKISTLYADTERDFKGIVLREENLLAAMEAVSPACYEEDCFEAHGIRIFKATEKQKEEVMRHLADGLDQKVVEIYRVIDKAKKANFDDYLKTHHIKKVKQFWHGSRNENWLSIMMNGLQLNPNAYITGKMFGQGIYFAPRAQKSFGYTSCEGSYWARGTSKTGFMGLYATAYGNPLMVNSSGRYTQQYVEGRGANCVHATPANTGLRNEEVVYYDEHAMVLNYIVKFAS